MTALFGPLSKLAVSLFLRLGELAAHHELADPAEVFDKMDRPLISASPVQALLAALGILLIPLVIIGLVFWSRRSRQS
ncbi:MAG: hypothetical protein ACE5JS_09880 [Nitrospinota bacterium]